jgi:MFS superfamily sulfate permease-like transporter
MEHKEAKYYEEFSVDGKNIIYINFSTIRTIEDFSEALEKVKNAIACYPKNSLYTITNMANVRIDTFYKDNFIKYGEHNKPYVKKAVLIGLDGVKKMIITTIFKKAGRDNFHIAFSKEKAIEWILQQD